MKRKLQLLIAAAMCMMLIGCSDDDAATSSSPALLSSNVLPDHLVCRLKRPCKAPLAFSVCLPFQRLALLVNISRIMHR